MGYEKMQKEVQHKFITTSTSYCLPDAIMHKKWWTTFEIRACKHTGPTGKSKNYLLIWKDTSKPVRGYFRDISAINYWLHYYGDKTLEKRVNKILLEELE